MEMTNAFRYFLVYLMQIVYAERGNMEAFIVGGEYTDIRQYPHAAFIIVKCETPSMCGSSVLNQQILITAAHCIIDCSLKKPCRHKIMAVLGNENLKEADIFRSATEHIPHKDYNTKNFENDIGLVLLRREVPFSDKVKRIIVARKFLESGSEGLIAGWGHTGLESTSNVLKHVYQRVRSTSTCSKIGQLQLGMFCAFHSTEQQSFPSMGDSGSGLVTVNGYTLMGLVSYKNRNYEHLLVYTNTTYYYRWIEKNAKILYCEG